MEKYLKNATGEKETLEAEKKEVLEKLRPLQKVQRSVDLVMMEIEDQPDPENLLAEEKTACRDQIQKKDRVKKNHMEWNYRRNRKCQDIQKNR